ncbi:transcriptional regulator [Actinokineospora bangkokensis]|uniref:Transcriptional regulator n=1 Tax=Actinokineospora bangkokensis TaxID=1193682 RepID=A0A1Q9LMW3_9PSEU|nr:transcriptional regulator [Actinokineospora bangkokensis]
MLAILQNGGTRTVADLARRLEVDERTVRRYVEHLVDLDVPVRSVRGRHGGYRLAPGYRMPPLMLTDDEALAVLLGLVASRRAGLLSTSASAAEGAAAKVRRVLPEALGARLDALLEVAAFTAPARPGLTAETEVLLTLARAARDRHPVALTYTAGHGRTSERVVHPYGVVAHSGRWYVTGHDSASSDLRTFRVDRISAVQVRAGAFTAPEDFDAGEHLVSALAAAPHRHRVVVRVNATPERVRAVFPPTVATLEPVTGEGSWLRARFQVESLDWVPAALAALDRPFAVEEPAELRDRVRGFAARLTAWAGEG